MATDNEKKYLDLEGLSQVFDMIEETYVNKESYSSEKSELEEKINDEVTRATAKEEELDGKISDLEGKVEEITNALEEEIERAKGEEKTIADDLAEEKERAEAKENELDEAIKSEAQAREDADTELQEAIDALGSEANEKYFAKVQYISAEHTINFMNDNGDVIGDVDTTEFVKDGMIENVELVEGEGENEGDMVLKITFNTDAEKDVIEINVKDLFESTNYYTKEETDEKFVPWTFETGRGRQIVLDNDGMILGLPNEGELEGKIPANGACNLLMLNKWNVVDLGSVKYPINLNGTKGAHPTYNDNIEIAFVSDIDSAKGDLESAIEAEKERAEQAEQDLQDAIDNLDEKVDNTVEDLEGKITAEQERAEAKENELDEAIKSEATTREEEDGKLSQSISDEKERAEAKENELEGKIEDLDEKIDGTVEDFETAIATEKQERQEADNQIETDYKAADETLQGNIDALENTMNTKFGELDGKISQEITDRTNADTTLQENIDAEATARENKDNELNDAITGLTETVNSNYTELDGKISAEVTRATEAEEELQKNIDAKQDKGDYVEYTPYIEGRKTIQLKNYDSLSGIKTDGGGVNLAMVSKWDVADFGSAQLPINLNGSAERPTYNDDKEIALLGDIDAAKGNLEGLLEEEKTARETADTTLQGNIDTLEGELTTFKTEVADTYETKEDASAFKTSVEETYAKKDEIPSLEGYATEEWVEEKKYFDAVDYDTEAKAINFSSNGEIVGTIDATGFIKDGMVKNVEIVDTTGTKDDVQKGLKITFITETGTEEVILAIGDLFDAGLYITEEQVQSRINVLETSIRNSINTIVNTTNGLSEKVGGLDARVSILENRVTDSLPGDIAGLKSAIDKLNGGVDVEGSVDKKIKDAIAELALKIEEIQKAFDEINNH